MELTEDNTNQLPREFSISYGVVISQKFPFLKSQTNFQLEPT